MESEWVKFFELVERLQAVSPKMLEHALRYGQSKDQEVLEEVERELGRGSATDGPREPFFEHSPEANKVNLRRCQDFLGELRRQEDQLRETQARSTQDLLQVQAARRAFEKTLKEMLQAEQRSFASAELAVLHATEEEVAAGLEELKEKGGLELHQFIGELKQVLHDRGRTGV